MDSPNLSILQPYTFAIVAKTNNNSTGRDFLFDKSGSGGGRSIIAMDFNGKIQLWANSWGNTNFSTPSDFFVLSAVFNSSDSSLSLNGNNVANLNPGTSSLNGGVRIGAHQNPADFLKGSIAEILIFNENLNSSARASVEAYIAHKWGLGANLPSAHPFKNGSSLFDLDANGTLSANQIFDYETDDRNYTITVFAIDDDNASFDKNFTITVTNVVEDLDGDGIEDHNDTDIDGDGLTNAENSRTIPTHGMRAPPTARPPISIPPKNLTIAENSAIGTVIGEFNATDPDGEGNFTYSFTPPAFEGFSPFLWLDANDQSTWLVFRRFLSGEIKAGNNFHANQSNTSYQPSLLESNGSSMIRFDGTNDRMEVGTILSTSSEIEVFLVAHKEASDGETFQRIISSFGSGSSNDWTAPSYRF